jgi:DNA-binding NtrC family response regulator
MAHGNVKLLIVDDDEDLRATLANFVSRMGVGVSCAGSVAEASRLLSSETPSFDVILTDLKLPGGSGLEIVRAAHECNPQALVSILTGYGSLQTAIEAIRLGAYDYITKPFSLDEIGVQVRNMVERVALAKENSRLSLRLQELYQQISRLQTERVELISFQDEIRRELKENRLKLDSIVRMLGRDPAPSLSDRLPAPGLLLDIEPLKQ